MRVICQANKKKRPDKNKKETKWKTSYEIKKKKVVVFSFFNYVTSRLV